MPTRPDASHFVGLDEFAVFVQLPTETVRKLILRHALPPLDIHPGGYRAIPRSAIEAAGVLIGRAAVAAELGFTLAEMQGLWRSMRVGGIVEINRQMVSTRQELDRWCASPAGAHAVDELRRSLVAERAQGGLSV